MITSRDNDIIKYCIKLQKDKKLRATDKRFFVEGDKLIESAAENDIPIQTLLFTESGSEKYRDTFEKAQKKSETILEISDQLGKIISDSVTPQGLFAILSYKPEDETMDEISVESKIIILENIQDPGNVGTIIRSALAFSIDMVIFSGCCDIYSQKVLRSTVGAIFNLKYLRTESLSETIGVLHDKGIKIYGAALHGNPKPISYYDIGCGAAVIVGNEGSGITHETMSLCDDTVFIPMNPLAESLNASTAASVIMWEMSKDIALKNKE